MPPKIQKSKAAKMLAAQSSSKSKGKKKKWSKGKLREKKNHRVVFNKELLTRFLTDVPKKMKVVTIYALVDQFKINGSLARRGIRELLSRNLIVPVLPSGTMAIYTRNPAIEKAEAARKAAEAEKGGDDKKKATKGSAKSNKKAEEKAAKAAEEAADE